MVSESEGVRGNGYCICLSSTGSFQVRCEDRARRIRWMQVWEVEGTVGKSSVDTVDEPRSRNDLLFWGLSSLREFATFNQRMHMTSMGWGNIVIYVSLHYGVYSLIIAGRRESERVPHTTEESHQVGSLPSLLSEEVYDSILMCFLISLSAANSFDKAFKKPHNSSESSIINNLSTSNAWARLITLISSISITSLCSVMTPALAPVLLSATAIVKWTQSVRILEENPKPNPLCHSRTRGKHSQRFITKIELNNFVVY